MAVWNRKRTRERDKGTNQELPPNVIVSSKKTDRSDDSLYYVQTRNLKKEHARYYNNVELYLSLHATQVLYIEDANKYDAPITTLRYCTRAAV